MSDTPNRRQFVGMAAAVASTPALGAGPVPRSLKGLTVALVQFDAVPEKVEKNLASIERLSEQAAAGGANWVVFHEGALSDYTPRVAELAERVPYGPSTRRLEDVARRLNCSISFGLSEADAERYYITQVFVQPDGFSHRYRKTWLFYGRGDEHFRDEWARYDPGTGPEAFNFDGIRAACFICADGDSRRCIERIRQLSPEVVFYPNNRTSLGDFEKYGDLAKTIGAPLLVVNRVGMSWEKETTGGCVVYGADGKVLTKANRDGKAEILYWTF